MANGCFKRDVLAIHLSDLHKDLRKHTRHTKESSPRSSSHSTSRIWSMTGALLLLVCWVGGVGLRNSKENKRKARTGQEMQQNARSKPHGSFGKAGVLQWMAHMAHD